MGKKLPIMFNRLRKSSLAYKRERLNARRQNSTQTAKKGGKTYETWNELNLDLSIMPASTVK